MANVVFEETICFIVCRLSKKGKAKKTFYQCEYEKRDSISAIFSHVEANINSIQFLKNYLWRSSLLTNLVRDESESFGQITFQKGTSHVKELPKYIPERLHRALFFDNFVKLTVIFVILFHKTVVKSSLDNNLLNVNI